jgi:hypothetical protein
VNQHICNIGMPLVKYVHVIVATCEHYYWNMIYIYAMILDDDMIKLLIMCLTPRVLQKDSHYYGVPCSRDECAGWGNYAYEDV